MVKSLGYGIGEIIKCFALVKNSTKINDQNCGMRVAFNKNFIGGRRYLQPPPPLPKLMYGTCTFSKFHFCPLQGEKGVEGNVVSKGFRPTLVSGSFPQ